MGEKTAGTCNLISCRVGRTPACGGHAPPDRRDSSRTRAEDLLKSTRRRGASCIIAGVQMPGMTGLELYTRLVASGEPIPAILITVFPDERTRERALQSCVSCYLIKPFSEDDLLACVGATLGHGNAVGSG
jgi:FixJ family two-component response regulator